MSNLKKFEAAKEEMDKLESSKAKRVIRKLSTKKNNKIK